MLHDLYSKLHILDSSPECSLSIAEKKHAYRYLTERHLQALWLDQKFFKDLETAEGLPIRILSPGIWNGEAGPDFLKAHLVIGDKEYRGDIELHLFEESWLNHKHHLDPRYDRVILHVSLWKNTKSSKVFTSKGTRVPCTFLEGRLTVSESRILKKIDLDLYPYKHFVGIGRCAQSLFDQLPIDKIDELLKSAALWRLLEKRQSILSLIPNPADYFAAGIAMALGYKQNTEIFLDLFLKARQQKFPHTYQLMAYLLGLCGFFTDAYYHKWSSSQFYRFLYEEFTRLPIPIDPECGHALKFHQCRPANHPLRRIAALAKVVQDESIINLGNCIHLCWQQNWQSGKHSKWNSIYNQLICHLPSYHDDYWEHHYHFEMTPSQKRIAWMGPDLKKEIFINVVMPWMYDKILERNDAQELMAFGDFSRSISVAKTKKAVYLSKRFFGDNHNNLLYKAHTQQGAFQIHRDFCMHYEASCVGCPFVERYKNATSIK